jgi:phosphoribosylaminoimidazole synthetase
MNYKDAGVDIQKGDEFVEEIKKMSPAGIASKIGLFGAVFDLKNAGFKDPLLVSGTDGVGTKLCLAQRLNKHDTIGIDLVAMCVNDILCHGAKPLFFLDYYATGKLDLGVSKQIIAGILEGCRLSGCELVGGETAEMPILYKEGEYDLGGFVVGAVEREEILPKTEILEGDVLIGLPSSGVHSSGFSIVNKLTQAGKIDLQKWGEILLEPTKIYVPEVLKILQEFKGAIKGISHITGGGLESNTMRIIPKGLGLDVKWNAWERPEIFDLIQNAGNILEDEMRRVFNLGIGLVLVLDRDFIANEAREFLKNPNKKPSKFMKFMEDIKAEQIGTVKNPSVNKI